MTGLRAKQKARRREMIEKAAVHLFEKKGFSVTTIEDISEQALVSPATVYNYYGNKGELLLALIAHGEEDTRSKRAEYEQRAISEDPADLLTNIIGSNMQNTLRYMSRELWGHVVAYVATTSDPDVAPRYLAGIADDLAAALADTLQKYIELGVLRPLDAEQYAYLMTRLERNHFLGFIYLKSMTIEEMLAGVRKDITLLVESLKA